MLSSNLIWYGWEQLYLFINVFLSELLPSKINILTSLSDQFQGQRELETDKLELLKLALARNLARASQEEGILEWARTNRNVRLLVCLDCWHVRRYRIGQPEMDLSPWCLRATPKTQMFLWNCIAERASQSCIMFNWNRWPDWIWEAIHHFLDQSQIGFYGCGKLSYATNVTPQIWPNFAQWLQKLLYFKSGTSL